MIKPKKLQRGSRIAIVSPSWGGPSLFPGIYAKGIQNLRDVFGFEIVEYPTARMDAQKIYANPALRARDINDAFRDPTIEAIIATIGGYESVRILRYLDVEAILDNPKIIMGYSDTVTLLAYLNYRGLVTVHGPAVMAGWAQIGNFAYLPAYYTKMLMEVHTTLPVEPFPTWSNGYPDWQERENLGKVLNLQRNTEGFRWIQGTRPVTGRLWGGCVEVLDFLKGTDFWPDKAFWNGRILMLETSEDKPTPQQVGYSIRNLGIQGILDKIEGILIGRPKDYSKAEAHDLYETVKTIVAHEFENPHLAIVGNLDFGHTDPNLIMPLGIKMQIDPRQKTLRLVEPIFTEEA